MEKTLFAAEVSGMDGREIEKKSMRWVAVMSNNMSWATVKWKSLLGIEMGGSCREDQLRRVTVGG